MSGVDIAGPASSEACVPTKLGARYLQQLCKHWAHKFAVELEDARGLVPFDPATRAEFLAEPEALRVRITAPDGERLAQMQRVVAAHLDRFAFREAPLSFDWT
ncbi:DUF2218 domain-containing protein [Sphingomonas morindae]|uniref:DUF2218 domain-containing protein n=1 Tax=Sphingomonas morindae TaxID=1541170 RepID=A0ABY4X4E5_9SPHN|nr:DUF2218 domain-containing protein [Sphingomonas morindae]USI71741.1 DUF2218 domain-containing protein [Sphingomonas morindae]